MRVLLAALCALPACSLIADLGELSASDASLDATHEAGDAAPFCASKSSNRIFCSDFDEQPSLAGWVVSSDDGLTGGVTDARSLSLPNAFFSSSPVAPDGGT